MLPSSYKDSDELIIAYLYSFLLYRYAIIVFPFLGSSVDNKEKNLFKYKQREGINYDLYSQYI